MNELYSLLKDTLMSEIDPAIAVSKAMSYISKNNNLSKCRPILRTLECLRDNKIHDFCANLRQSICYFPNTIDISYETFALLKDKANDFGFVITDDGVSYHLNIEPNMFKDIPDLSSRYDFQYRKSSDYSIGDGPLFGCFGYKNYLTLTQKYLMYLIKNMQANETILACLPTGGGKSLSWELPALSGTLSGMAIVVVPTIALACDHEKASKQVFDNGSNVRGKVIAYHSDMPIGKKQELINEISSGEILILYISPEALLGKDFKEAVFNASSMGLVGMLVVDEAHLIAQWGVRFRPEFQLLAAFRNKLEAVSPRGIHTLLLSATLNNEDRGANLLNNEARYSKNLILNLCHLDSNI